MPFAEVDIVDERIRFVEDAQRSLDSFSAVCDRYGISRTTGYEWLDRWKKRGREGLENRSSRAKHCPWATSPDVIEAILEVRAKYEHFGPKKIRWYLSRNQPELKLPSRQTIHNILARRGLVRKRRRRHRRWHPGRPEVFADEPNATWSAASTTSATVCRSWLFPTAGPADRVCPRT